MEAAMNPPIRRTPSPPEPVDVSNPQWIARAWQWVFDRLSHLDECLDDTKDSQTELRAEITAWMASSKDDRISITDRLREHLEEHEQLENTLKARRSVWKQQWSWLKEIARLATSTATLGVAAYVLKQLGVI